MTQRYNGGMIRNDRRQVSAGRVEWNGEPYEVHVDGRVYLARLRRVPSPGKPGVTEIRHTVRRVADPVVAEAVRRAYREAHPT